MSTGAPLRLEFHLRIVRSGAPETDRAHNGQAGRLPRITRLLALAIKFEGLIRVGMVKDYSELARLGGVSRARITQIMALRNLAPDIQDRILFLNPVIDGRDPITEHQVRRVCGLLNWREQRRVLCPWFSAPLDSPHKNISLAKSSPV